jgi:hypothetical protein
VKAIFYAMITLAVASAFQTLASQLSDFTGGEDGLTFKNPRWLSPAFEPFEARCSAWHRRQALHLLPAVRGGGAAVPDLLLRIVNSPFGRVLQAIRENDFRAEAIGYRTVVYRTWSNVLSAAVRHAGRRAAGAVAALRRARHHAELRDHARHPADRRHRRHGHDVRRGGRRGAVRAGAELPAGPAQARRTALEGVPVLSPSSRPTAGCSGWACCSCCRSTTSPPASSAGCGLALRWRS